MKMEYVPEHKPPIFAVDVLCDTCKHWHSRECDATMPCEIYRLLDKAINRQGD